MRKSTIALTFLVAPLGCDGSSDETRYPLELVSCTARRTTDLEVEVRCLVQNDASQPIVGFRGDVECFDEFHDRTDGMRYDIEWDSEIAPGDRPRVAWAIERAGDCETPRVHVDRVRLADGTVSSALVWNVLR